MLLLSTVSLVLWVELARAKIINYYFSLLFKKKCLSLRE